MHERLPSLHLGPISQPRKVIPSASLPFPCQLLSPWFLSRKLHRWPGKKPHQQPGSFVLLPPLSGQGLIPVYTHCPFQQPTLGVLYSKEGSLTKMVLFHGLKLLIIPAHLLVSTIHHGTKSQFSLRMYSLPTAPLLCQPSSFLLYKILIIPLYALSKSTLNFRLGLLGVKAWVDKYNCSVCTSS